MGLSTFSTPSETQKNVLLKQVFAKLQKTFGMESQHKDVLIMCHEALLEDLEPSDVLPHLIQTKVLTFDHQEIIKNITSRKGRCEEFLTILPTRGPRAYEVFVKALEKTQPFLACILLRAGRYRRSVCDIAFVSQFKRNRKRDFKLHLGQVAGNFCSFQPSCSLKMIKLL